MLRQPHASSEFRFMRGNRHQDGSGVSISRRLIEELQLPKVIHILGPVGDSLRPVRVGMDLQRES